MQTALELLLAFVALYPVTTAALWIAGGLMFRLSEERPGDPAAGARGRLAGCERPDPRLQRGGGDRHQRAGGVGLRLPAARGAGAR